MRWDEPAIYEHQVVHDKVEVIQKEVDLSKYITSNCLKQFTHYLLSIFFPIYHFFNNFIIFILLPFFAISLPFFFQKKLFFPLFFPQIFHPFDCRLSEGGQRKVMSRDNITRIPPFFAFANRMFAEASRRWRGSGGMS
jgi:hypothetical protein